MITIEILPGNDIYNAGVQAIRLARATGEVVQFQFNDRRIRVTNSDTIPQVDRRYRGAKAYRKMKRRSGAWWAKLGMRERRAAVRELENEGSYPHHPYRP